MQTECARAFLFRNVEALIQDNNCNKLLVSFMHYAGLIKEPNLARLYS
jgi:hypothetical protein